MLFLRKTDETIWNPFYLREPSPLSTNPPTSEQFFHDPPFCPNFKNEIPLPPPNIKGEGRGGIYGNAKNKY